MATNSSDIEIKTFKDFFLNYNKLAEMCFMDCIHDFTFREVSKREEQCAENCFDKFVKLNNRISQRFQEIQFAQHENISASVPK
ncbi:mitochondrial import inner membrane translocase subunit Tim9 [Dermatophagoides farinae]|uniref:Mitochondrial import inner membrane translocase subunit n=1 Tax=Dermatophagoides farinae TaxID=6954 RepID=A0A922L3X8_DERFA|nr:mitochondrial import inner membrane translocase subunit Tim9-like [Dermatophagoides farinae]KAH7637061.1 mitochondrial import inner membrane translocase subunit tim9-like [Dermatophagoides farinae]KAH9510835.1 Mitochondrial import inner membrane translocase subunit Tim9 [Dermatophagoides farinae]